MIRHFCILFWFICALSCADAFGGTMILEGTYQNKNLYVQNSIASSGVGFCAYEVRINGELSWDEINSSAFEIDLSLYNLGYGQTITIAIKHKDDGCLPKIINPEAIKPNPTYETTFITVDESGLVKWATVNETSKLPFVIEQYKWNKWIPIGEVMGNGVPTTSTYGFQANLISGLNKFRIKQKGYIDKTKFSPTVSLNNTAKEVSYVYLRKKRMINFSEPTGYEVYNKFGELVKKGFGDKVSVSNLTKETFYMNYGNTQSEIYLR
ncbi:MAG: hypothetical protein MRY83_16620 [Flavobacteriales bacterium]|nr:hypothetical protein [Flavobacteriales bacterium]